MSGNGKWDPTPSHYHCVFFDSERQPVTRAWVKSRFIVKFQRQPPGNRTGENYTTRISKAVQSLTKASELGLVERRKKFCFLARFEGVWGPFWTEEEPVNEVEVARIELEKFSKEMPTSGELRTQIGDVSLNRSESSLFSESFVGTIFNQEDNSPREAEPATSAQSDCLRIKNTKKRKQPSARWIFSFLDF